MEDRRTVVHLAAWPEDGQQICRRCKEVLVDGTDGESKPVLKPGAFIGVEPGKEPVVMIRDAAGADEVRCTRRTRATWAS